MVATRAFFREGRLEAGSGLVVCALPAGLGIRGNLGSGDDRWVGACSGIQGYGCCIWPSLENGTRMGIVERKRKYRIRGRRQHRGLALGLSRGTIFRVRLLSLPAAGRIWCRGSRGYRGCPPELQWIPSGLAGPCALNALLRLGETDTRSRKLACSPGSMSPITFMAAPSFIAASSRRDMNSRENIVVNYQNLFPAVSILVVSQTYSI